MAGEAAGGQGSGGDSGGAPAPSSSPSESTASSAPTSPGAQAPSGVSEGQGQTSESDNSLSSGFLQQIPEADRAIIAPYIEQWDAGVTRRFQELHSEYSPYKQFLEAGYSAEDFGRAQQLYEMLDQDPKTLYNLLTQHFAGEEEQALSGQEQGQVGTDDLGDIPPALQERLQKQDQLLEAMAQHIIGQQEAQQTAEQDKQYAEYLKTLKTQFGEFDEDFVTTKIANGMSGEGAVKEYLAILERAKGELEKQGAGPGAQVPPVLSGNGAPSIDLPDIKGASKGDTIDLVANLLKASNSTGA